MAARTFDTWVEAVWAARRSRELLCGIFSQIQHRRLAAAVSVWARRVASGRDAARRRVALARFDRRWRFSCMRRSLAAWASFATEQQWARKLMRLVLSRLRHAKVRVERASVIIAWEPV